MSGGGPYRPGPMAGAANPERAGLLEGRAAIVAGVGPGLGRAISLALAREGAGVALAARRPAELEVVAHEIEARAGAPCAPPPT